MAVASLVYTFVLFDQAIIAKSWSKAGHERIAQITVQLLEGKKRDRVTHMMKGDLLEFVDWEDQMSKKYPETQALHFHRQVPEWGCRSSLNHVGSEDGLFQCASSKEGVERGSLFCAMAYFFEHFAHDALLSEYPQPKKPIGTPESLSVLDKVGKADLKPSSYLRWLSGLVGDLHQPLHWLPENDYGRNIKVSYQGVEYTLFSFWEDYLPTRLPPLGAKATLKKQYETRNPAWWYRMPTELFREWANETSRVICGQVYAALETNVNGSREIQSPVTLQEEVVQRWVSLAHDFTSLSGDRLAFILSDILEHRKHRQAHKEGRGHRHHQRSAGRGFGTNIMIALVVVPVILLAMKWHYMNPDYFNPNLGFRRHLKM